MYEIEILEISDLGSIDEAERFFISYFRGLGCRLTNQTSGGEGTLGRIHGPETREKIRAKAMGRKASPETLEKLQARPKRLGGNRSAEMREKIRVALLGRKRSPESIEKSRVGNLGRKHTAEAIEKIRTWHSGRKASPETIEKMRKEGLGRTANLHPVIDEMGMIHPSIASAARHFDLWVCNIIAVLRGRQRQTGGHVFRYAP